MKLYLPTVKALQLETVARYLWINKTKVLPKENIENHINEFNQGKDLIFEDKNKTIIIKTKYLIDLGKDISVFTDFIRNYLIYMQVSNRTEKFELILFINCIMQQDIQKKCFEFFHKEIQNLKNVELLIYDFNKICEELEKLQKDLSQLFKNEEFGKLGEILQSISITKNFVTYIQLSGIKTFEKFLDQPYFIDKKIIGEYNPSNKEILEEKVEKVERPNKGLLRHFSPKIASKILKEKENNRFSLVSGDKLQDLIFLVADLKNFSKLINITRNYEVIHHFINKYYIEVEETVKLYEGMLDKFIGDGVLAIFGIPFKENGYEKKALECAKSIINIGYSIQKKWLEYIDIIPPEIGVRVGMAMGEAIIIDLSDEDGKLEHLSIISNELNIAARFESEAPVNGISLTNSYYCVLGKPNYFKSMGEISIKGFEDKYKIYVSKIIK